MKTIIIYDQCGEHAIQFFVVDGDYSHLNNVYINNTEDQAKTDELSDLLYGEDGRIQLKAYKKFPIKAAKEGANVIVAGFAP